MNDFHGLLSSDFGLKPQGKSAPMAPPRHNPTSTTNSALNFEIGGRPSSLSKSSSGSFLDDRDTLSRPPSSTTNRKPQDYSNLGGFDDVFVGGGGNSRSGGNSNSPVILDSIFSGSADTGSNFSSMPVFDKPVYDDDDVFDGVSGLKSSSSGRYDGLFNSSSKKNDAFDDFLGGLGRRDPESKGFRGPSTRGVEKGIPGFDDLLNGFGVNSASVPTDKTSSSSSWRQKSTASGGNMHSNIIDDPFVVLGTTTTPAPSSSVVFDGPVEHMSNLNRSNSNKVNNSAGGPVFDDINPFEGFGKFVPAFSSERGYKEKDNSPLRTEHGAYGRQTFDGIDDKSNIKSPERGPEKKIPAEDYGDSPRTVIEIPSASDSHRSVPDTCAPSYADPNFNETNFDENVSPRSQENTDSADDIWLSVSKVPLFTQPTAAPPPSRPPPPRPAQFPRAGRGSFTSHAKKKDDDYSAFSSSTAPFQSPRSIPVGAKSSSVSVIEELENFAMGKSQNNVNGSSDVLSGENMDANSVAAAMKEAMDKAEAKFKHVKEVRERENAKAARMQQISEDKTTQDARERDLRERQEQLEREHQERMEEEEKRQREEEERRRIEREREEKEREQRKLVRERELGRQAVERATREARERAAAGARARAERAAVERAQAEARERAERAAVQRVQAEARERAARDAKEKAEKVAAEARERARAHAREKEAQERAAAAAAAAKASQQKNDDDLETFFGMGSRAGSAPRPRDPVFNTQFQNKQVNEDVRTSAGSTNNMGKASYSANIVDDLSSIFGGPPSSGEFQEVEGESEERRRARLERHQRTQERAAKAVAEKNQRDLQTQTEQAERHRIAETLDVEIKRWASGKEGNLRALLSTLQYVLWPESGWHPVSLTDLITAASVKKVYRKATLCIHPDKVQQKGATLPQKYIAEKVFDILKEAWNKFNSEELF